MNIQIRAIGIPPTEALSAHIERRIAFALSAFMRGWTGSSSGSAT